VHQASFLLVYFVANIHVYQLFQLVENGHGMIEIDEEIGLTAFT
jgi:hypothetical protein